MASCEVPTDVEFWVALGYLCVCSVLFLARGARWLRWLSAAAAGGGVSYAIHSTGWLVDDGCIARWGLVLGTLGIVALLVVCMHRIALLGTGAAAGGAVAHFAYEALPIAGASSFAGRDVWYWSSLGIGALIGIVLTCWREVMRLATSILGGAGIALATHLLVSRFGGNLPGVVYLVVAITLSVLGFVCLQRKRNSRASNSTNIEIGSAS